MDWDQAMQEISEDTDDIDKGLVRSVGFDGVVEVGKPKESSKYEGMTDKEIVSSLLKPVIESSRGKEANFETRQERSMKWLPKESLLSYNIAADRRMKLWVVKALVLLRDDGLCRVCGERVKGQTWKVLREDKEVRMKESNCFLVCKDCALCHLTKDVGGRNRLERFKNMKLMVLKRRMKGVRDCGELKEFGMTSMVLLARDKDLAEGKLDSRLVRNELRRLAKEKSALG